jgi:predicted AAA+ superfamily ATPase
LEVDFILGNHEVALEVKGTLLAQSHHLKGLKAFGEEYKTKRRLLVSRDPRPRLLPGDIEVLPWKTFLEDLWGGKIMR